MFRTSTSLLATLTVAFASTARCVSNLCRDRSTMFCNGVESLRKYLQQAAGSVLKSPVHVWRVGQSDDHVLQWELCTAACTPQRLQFFLVCFRNFVSVAPESSTNCNFSAKHYHGEFQTFSLWSRTTDSSVSQKYLTKTNNQENISVGTICQLSLWISIWCIREFV